MTSSSAILERFRVAHGKDVDLSLRSPYANLLTAFGNPEKNLPSPILVAGTNGKGSTCAFLRAFIEASGHTAHVYTSPHLLTFHERIRVAGNLISEEELSGILLEAERLAEPGGVSIFEVATTAALVAFARTKADVTILEVGLGGRLDATNIVPNPVASLISRLSFDHRDYLGNSMAEIAREKAGIMRSHTPCFVAPQPDKEALNTLLTEAEKKHTPLQVGGKDWSVTINSDGTFSFESATRSVEKLPPPALIGIHQYTNAALAIAALSALPFKVDDRAIRVGLQSVSWLGRLQRLTQGPLVDVLGEGDELWLDGGHNDSAGEILAAQIQSWKKQDNKPIDLVFGMLSSKAPEEFLGPFLSFVEEARTVRIDGEIPGIPAEVLASKLSGLGVRKASPASTVLQAINSLKATGYGPRRILVTGSLFLVARSLKENLH